MQNTPLIQSTLVYTHPATLLTSFTLIILTMSLSTLQPTSDIDIPSGVLAYIQTSGIYAI